MPELVDLPGCLRLQAGCQHLDLVPAVGGSIARLFEVRDGQVFHWLRPATAEGIAARDPDRMASFPLVPFCNRIRNGSFMFDGRVVHLPPAPSGSPHSIHGSVRNLVWDVEQHSADSAQLRVVHPAGAWPWHFSASQKFDLAPDALHVTMRLTNLDSRSMPLGMGHHPFLLHRTGTRLRVEVAQMWAGDREVMPTGLVRPVGLLESLRAGVLLETLDLDNNFTGWSRRARVDWPEEARSLMLSAETPLDYFVLYCPRGGEHFCIEPVSQCTDWVNLQGTVPADALGGHVLAPRAQIEMRFSLHFGGGDPLRTLW